MIVRSPKRVSFSMFGAVIAISLLSANSDGEELELLDALEKGEWLIKFRDGSADRKICLRTGEELIQLRHGKSKCGRYLIRDEPAHIVVQYTCRDNGYGRTDIRRESSDLVQIESQGIENRRPFQFAGEARRIGACSK